MVNLTKYEMERDRIDMIDSVYPLFINLLDLLRATVYNIIGEK